MVNVVVLITGGAVRLTGSGLGCPTWPRCTDRSYVTTPEAGIHGYVEFGNRVLGVLVGVVVVAAFLATVFAAERRRSLIVLSTLLGATIPAQAVLGGITVLTGLNPWTVAAHFLVSIGVLAIAYALWVRSGEGDGPAVPLLPPALRSLVRLLVGVCAAVLVIGTIVTGSGPHAGDTRAARTGLDPGMVAQLHADLVFGLIGLTVATWFALRATGAPAAVRRATAILIGVELGQGLIGFVQYFTHLPVILVGFHLAGAAVVWLAALALLFATRVRGPVPATPAVITGQVDRPAGESAGQRGKEPVPVAAPAVTDQGAGS